MQVYGLKKEEKKQTGSEPGFLSIPSFASTTATPKEGKFNPLPLNNLLRLTETDSRHQSAKKSWQGSVTSLNQQGSGHIHRKSYSSKKS